MTRQVKKFFLLTLLIGTLVSTPALAQDSMTSITGNWFGEDVNGQVTELIVGDNGRFTFRQVASRDLTRSYYCGTLTDQASFLSLSIALRKERSADGVVEQAAGRSFETLALQSRSENRLVVEIDGRNVVLERNAG